MLNPWKPHNGIRLDRPILLPLRPHINKQKHNNNELLWKCSYIQQDLNNENSSIQHLYKLNIKMYSNWCYRLHV